MFKAGLIGTAADHPVSIDAVHWLLGQLAGTTAGGAEEGRFAVLANSQRRQHLVEKAFELVAQRQVRFHDLRHSSATIALAAGVDLKFVSERLGHTTIAITADLYLHPGQTMREAAAQKINDASRLGAKSVAKQG